MAAESPRGKILSRPQSLTAKLVCFGFASANHIAGNHIVRIVYFPDCSRARKRFQFALLVLRHKGSFTQNLLGSLTAWRFVDSSVTQYSTAKS